MSDTIVWWSDPDADQSSGIYRKRCRREEGVHLVSPCGSEVVALPEEVEALKVFPPVTGYKGGKRRWAGAIADLLLQEGFPASYTEVGVGSGAVMLELLRRGIPACQITCIDAGPWGRFWQEIGEGTFDLQLTLDLLEHAQHMEQREVKAWLEDEVARMGYQSSAFVLLQAGSFGSSPVWHDGERWRRGDVNTIRLYKARSFWEPSETSRETKPRGTLFAIPKIMHQLKRISIAGRGLKGLCCDIDGYSPESSGLCYIDPPYAGTSGYGFRMPLNRVIARFREFGPVFVSEGVPLGEPSFLLGKSKGGDLSIGANRREEWLTKFPSLQTVAA